MTVFLIFCPFMYVNGTDKILGTPFSIMHQYSSSRIITFLLRYSRMNSGAVVFDDSKETNVLVFVFIHLCDFTSPG